MTHALSTAVGVLWVVFWVYWMISAAGAKQGTRARRARVPGLLIAVLVVLVLHVFKIGSFAIHDPAVRALGACLVVVGLGLAVWARIYLGRNWGMPMTLKAEPELVTSGPYRFVRHPIYSGILLAAFGTALAVSAYWLIVVAVLGAYFIYSAQVEERLMASSFPAAYPPYRARTKMLIPFVL
ncbi:MAG TPA: isoprenylcysteine carboxylmethyltransferase family protein [Solirubrobacteraceae bacterium]|nr:isoprenylcysteine carboxylmethyltransferase family protein [Solirubrobacteraceae bacterium]